MIEKIAFVIGILGVAVLLLGYAQKKKFQIILCGIVSRALLIVQYFLIGSVDGAVFNISTIFVLLVAQNMDTPFVKRNKRACIVAVNAVVLVCTAFIFKNAFTLFALGGVLFHSNAGWFKRQVTFPLPSYIK